jgi:subtilase family serine protease
VAETVINQGGGDAVASSVTFYLSSDWIFDAADTPLNPARTVPALINGASSSGSTTLTIPAATPSGVYYIIARVDALNAIAETQEGNNTASYSVRIGPDLWVSYFYPTPNKSAAGGTVSVVNTITNQGGATAAASTVRFYFSTNYTLEAGDVQIGERAVPALAAGQFNSGSTPVQIPAGTAPGNYYLLAQADALGVVDESPETNNVTYVAIQVTIVP